MKRVWAPWRMEFISKDKRPGKSHCIFCDLPKEGVGHKTLILHQGQTAFVILNRYPYSNGHLMVVPNRHISDFSKLRQDEHAEMGALLGRCTRVLKKCVHAKGFNIGMNLGAVAGAGIKDHLHHHIVPRWQGDCNFMAVLDDIRVMPEHLKETYKLLKSHF